MKVDEIRETVRETKKWQKAEKAIECKHTRKKEFLLFSLCLLSFQGGVKISGCLDIFKRKTRKVLKTH